MDGALAGGGALRLGRIVHKAFQEHKSCMRDVQRLMCRYLRTPAETPAAFAVEPGKVPKDYFSFCRNLFSTLFMSVYHLLDIRHERRMLYGRINHLFRIWVTSADNLLDAEDKVVIPVRMKGHSRIMRQVITLMAGDRVLGDLLREGVACRIINASDSDSIHEQSLRCLLPSAAQEAAEEGGIQGRRPPADYVLSTIHRYKTGILFQVPFMGPEIVESGIDRMLMLEVQNALLNFGLGCQLIDDIRDMAQDLIEGRQNYVLSLVEQADPEGLGRLLLSVRSVDERLYLENTAICSETARKAVSMMKDALCVLGRSGLGFKEAAAERMAESMLNILDIGDLEYA